MPPPRSPLPCPGRALLSKAQPAFSRLGSVPALPRLCMLNLLKRPPYGVLLKPATEAAIRLLYLDDDLVLELFRRGQRLGRSWDRLGQQVLAEYFLECLGHVALLREPWVWFGLEGERARK